MHNKHHATPQKIKFDLDLDTTPLVAFFDRAVESNRSRPWSPLWLRFQAYSFVPLTAGVISMLFYTFYLHPRKAIRESNLWEIVCMISCHVLRPILITVVSGGSYSFGQAYLFHMACMWLSYVYLFGHFSLSHTFTPTVDEDENPNWVQYAVEHTVNIEPENPVVSWIMGYLNCQIEHHLFPQMPQYRQPELSDRIKQFCLKWNLQYQSVGYFEAWRLMLGNLNSVGRHYYDHGIDAKRMMGGKEE